MLDDDEEEDSREARELRRELDLVHGIDIAFEGPGIPRFDPRGRRAFPTASNPSGMNHAASSNEDVKQSQSPQSSPNSNDSNQNLAPFGRGRVRHCGPQL